MSGRTWRLGGRDCGGWEWPAPIATLCYGLPWGAAFYSLYPGVDILSSYKARWAASAAVANAITV